MSHVDSEQLALTKLSLPTPEALHYRKRIYCNRDLRLDLVSTVGFDMDYTLALYKQDALDQLSIEATVEKLVARGYPEALKTMPLELNFPIRGLLIDKQRGNILKTDRYSYPKKAFHGMRELSSSERRHVYANNRIGPGAGRYHSIDTLFALSEATLFAAAVDVLERELPEVDYCTVFEDIRACIDEAHRDGSIKDVIRGNPGAYIERDPELAPVLHKLRSAGKKTFVLTNSEADYTDIVMGYLLGEGEHDSNWMRYFDVVIASACKPLFFTEDERFIDVGAPDEPVEALLRGRVYQGGSLKEFERLCDLSGDHVLYVGDHIYGDVLRAKKMSAWRTLMIIQELRGELAATRRYGHEIKRMHALERRRYQLLDTKRQRQADLKDANRALDEAVAASTGGTELEASRTRLKRAVERIRSEVQGLESEYGELESLVDHAHHPFWGSAFKAESELSSFGEQVERYACIYTDRVTNLLHYGPHHFFRGPRHRMAHEP